MASIIITAAGVAIIDAARQGVVSGITASFGQALAKLRSPRAHLLDQTPARHRLGLSWDFVLAARWGAQARSS